MNIKRTVKYRASDIIHACQKLLKSDPSREEACRILMYHSIDNIDSEIDNMGLAVPPATFRMQMLYLKENGFNVIGLSELADKVKGRIPIAARSVAITFDDGYESILTNALPILKEFNFKSTLFANVYLLEKKFTADSYWHNWAALDWEGLKKTARGGISIGSHAMTHRSLKGLSRGELADEIGRSKKMIESNLNQEVRFFSYPHGGYDDTVKKAVEEGGFEGACSSLPGINTLNSDLFLLRRTEITSFDNTPDKFQKKLSGCYDWLAFLKR